MMFKHVCDVACRATCEVPIAYFDTVYVVYVNRRRAAASAQLSARTSLARWALRVFFPAGAPGPARPVCSPDLESRPPAPPRPCAGSRRTGPEIF